MNRYVYSSVAVLALCTCGSYQSPDATTTTRGEAPTPSAPSTVDEERLAGGTAEELATLAPCTTANTFILGSQRFSQDTIVVAECVRMSRDAVIRVEGGATLVVISKSSFIAEPGARLEASGDRGDRGQRGVEMKEVPIDDNHYRQGECNIGNDRPGEPNHDVVGKRGGTGKKGGGIKLFLARPAIGSSPALALNALGGPGGPPGNPGKLRCYKRSNKYCDGCQTDSPPARTEGFGNPGQTGSIEVVAWGDGSTLEAEKIQAAIGYAGQETDPPSVSFAGIKPQSYPTSELVLYRRRLLDEIDRATTAKYARLPKP